MSILGAFKEIGKTFTSFSFCLAGDDALQDLDQSIRDLRCAVYLGGRHSIVVDALPKPHPPVFFPCMGGWRSV